MGLGRKPGIAGSGGGPLWLTVAANDAPAIIKERADYVCDGVNDEVQINAALVAASDNGGVWLSLGTFNIGATITVNSGTPTAIMLRGVMDGKFGHTKLVKNATGTFPIITLTAGSLYLMDLEIEDGGSFAASGALISGASATTITLERVQLSIDEPGISAISASGTVTMRYSTISSDGTCILSTSNTTILHITDSTLFSYGSTTYAIDLQATGNSAVHRFVNSEFEGAGGVKLVLSTTSKYSHALFSACTIFADWPSTEGIYFKGAGSIEVGDSVIFGFDNNLGIYVENASAVAIGNVRSRDNINGGLSMKTVTGGTVDGLSVRGCLGNGGFGIKLDGCSGIDMSGLRVHDVDRHGIWLLDTDECNITDWYASNYSQQTDDTYSGLIIDGDSDTNSVQTGKARHGGTANKGKYGIRIDDSTCDTNLVRNNDLKDSAKTAGNEFSDAGTGTRGWDYIELQRSGTLTVAAVDTFRHRVAAASVLGRTLLDVATAPTGQAILVDVNKGGTTIYSTQANRPSVADGATQGSSTIAPDITSAAAGDYLTADIDQIGSGTAGADLIVLQQVMPL